LRYVHQRRDVIALFITCEYMDLCREKLTHTLATNLLCYHPHRIWSER